MEGKMIKNSITDGLGGKRSPSFGGHEVFVFFMTSKIRTPTRCFWFLLSLKQV
jgi:hypothetical protein